MNWTRLDGHTTTADGPELLLRLGLARSVELRLLAPDWSEAWDAGRRTSGWADLSAGFKGHLAAKGNDFSLRATAYLPSGSDGFSSQRLDPELAVAWSRALSERWSLGATVAQRWFRLAHQALTSPSLSLSCSLGPHAGTFVEYGANLGDGLRPAHKLDNGYTWTPGPRTQLDVSFGIALSPAAPSFFVGAGVSQRF